MRLAIEGGGFCQPVEEDEYEDDDLGLDSGKENDRRSGSGGANSDNE